MKCVLYFIQQLLYVQLGKNYEIRYDFKLKCGLCLTNIDQINYLNNFQRKTQY
jgi:hypothetical protein